MGPFGRVPGCRAGKRPVRLGPKCVIHLSKTGRCPPQQIALPLKPRRRRATWGPNCFAAIEDDGELARLPEEVVAASQADFDRGIVAGILRRLGIRP